MYTDIKTFEDACKALNLDSATIIPDFSLFPESDREAMIAHAKLIIVAKAINGDWVPDWSNWHQYKYYPWFNMDSLSAYGFSSDDYGFLELAYSGVSSRLCFETRDQAKYVGKQFEELYKIYFVKA